MDTRTYIRLHDGMPDHPKVVGLSDRAFRLYVESLCWCSRHLTDGMVSAAAMRRMGGWSPATVSELESACLIENGTPAGWTIHDYTEHQRTSAEVAEFRESRRTAGITGNHERWHVARNLIDPSCEFCAIGDASHERSHADRMTESQVRSDSDRKSSPETETDKRTKSKPSISAADRPPQPGSDQDPDFTAFWVAYPRKVGKGQARKAWRSAVVGKPGDPKVIIAAAEQFGASCRAKGTEQQFIPHPATWLNGERWGDDPGERGTGRLDYPTSPYGN